MNKAKLLLKATTVLVMLLATSNIAHAQATRTWVSGVGDDANPCSRTAPCKTFAGAISKTAAGGEIDVLDPGGFGAVTLTKAVTIDGGGNLAGVLVSGTNGIVVQAGANDIVILRNLDINGIGTGLNGIRFLSGKGLIIEKCQIYGFTQAGIDFEPSAASALAVNNTSVENNGGGGILIKPQASPGAAKATINQVIAVLNAFGVRAEDRATVTIRNTVTGSNVNNGFLAFSSIDPVVMNIEDSLAMDNAGTTGAAGVKSVGAGATVRLANVSTFNNSNGLVASGGNILSFSNNEDAGNITADGLPTGNIPLR